MNPIVLGSLSALSGGLFTVLVYFLVAGAKRLWRILTNFDRSLQAAVSVAEKLEQEMAWLRHMTVSGADTSVNLQSAPARPAAEEPRHVVGMPKPLYERFVSEEPEEEPKVESEVFSQSDEEMALEERMQDAREAGYIVDEPSDLPPGRMVDSV